MMPASAVFSPVPVTSTRRDPAPFTVPAITVRPAVLRTGRDSPVIIDSFTSLSPSRTTPSAGTPAPGRTSTRSPSRRSATRTISVRSPAIRSAVSGSSRASSFSAPWAWEIERISTQWPSTMIVTRVASSHQRSVPGKPSVTARLNTNATVMASAMSVIMPGRRSASSPAAPLTKTQPP
jgi:hypothetical protein